MRQDITAGEAKPNREGTLGALRRAIAARLATAFRESGRGGTPDLDARLLVGAAARIDPGTVPLRDEVPADADVARRAHGLAERRARGEPIARIVGRKEFWGLDLALAAATLVPRPDTETVVEAALRFAAARANQAPVRVLDLGTGSGAILLALLSELPTATGLGTDIAPAAATVAAENARRLGLAGRATFVVCSWTSAVAAGAFDLVVANPPYIPTGDIVGLDVEVRDHDPRRALDGGADGLSAIGAILADLRRILAPGARVFIEMGAGQRAGVAALAERAGFAASFVPDLGGIDRVAVLAP
jgi:release factor glutamine methyltransferase